MVYQKLLWSFLQFYHISLCNHLSFDISRFYVLEFGFGNYISSWWVLGARYLNVLLSNDKLVRERIHVALTVSAQVYSYSTFILYTSGSYGFTIHSNSTTAFGLRTIIIALFYFTLQSRLILSYNLYSQTVYLECVP